MPRKLTTEILLACVCFFSFLPFAGAYEDGFGPARKTEGKHFIVYASPGLDSEDLLQRLDIDAGDELLSRAPAGGEDDLAAALDTLYGRVGVTLDMNLYSLQGTLKICRDTGHLREVYRTLYKQDLQAFSFYSNDLSTIYISSDHFTKEVLGHEIAHMIISHYFVVPPPAKVAEILAGYVEYQLRKTSSR